MADASDVESSSTLSDLYKSAKKLLSTIEDSPLESSSEEYQVSL